LQPRLSEAVTLMETNIEEPLSTDDIANLVGLSRRQLERLFKQYLGSLPSRYYLELRLQRRASCCWKPTTPSCRWG
jgi:transcriptional regulator GlxA family with amidase domain